MPDQATRGAREGIAQVAGVRIHQLEGFYHVVRHGGFAAAVEALPYTITEPALHKQVRSLEAALGVELVRRGRGRKMTPTPEGRSLFRFAAPFYERLPGTLRTLADGQLATMQMVSESLYVEPLVAPALARYREAAPHAIVRCVETDGPGVVEAVQRGDADIGVGRERAQVPREVRFDPIGRLTLVLLAPKDHRLARKRSAITVDDLQDESFILYAVGTSGRRFTDSLMIDLGVRANAVAEATSVAAMTAFVEAGLGATVVPHLDIEERPRRRTRPSGVVEIDVTDIAGDASNLPQYGTYVRKEIADHLLLKSLREELSVRD